MVVYVADDGFDDEFNVLKKRLREKDSEIMKLKNNRNNHDTVIKDREADLQNVINSLGKKQYRITQLQRKLTQQKEREAELIKELEMTEKKRTQAKDEVQLLQEKLLNLRQRYGVEDSPQPKVQRSRSQQRQHLAPGNDAKQNNVNNNNPSSRLSDDVYTWSIEDVHYWWCNNLPQSAQEYSNMVKECQITGKDLVELDTEILEQLGIKKLLVMKILKAIEQLTQDAPSHNRSVSQARDGGGVEATTNI